MSAERWLSIPECNHFLVSDYGRVINTRTGHYRRLSKQGKGYLGFTLFRGKKSYRIHSLVAKLFCHMPESSKKLAVNHKDGNKHNNHYTNLEWVTYSENIRHAFANKLIPIGEDRPGSKLDYMKVMSIHHHYKNGYSLNELGIKFNVSASTIRSVVTGKKWKHVPR